MGEVFLSPSCLLFMLLLHFHIMSRKAEQQGRCFAMEGRFRFGCTTSAYTPTLFSLRHFITAMLEDEFTAEFFQGGCLYHGRSLYILQGPLQTQVFCQCLHVPAPRHRDCWMMQYLIWWPTEHGDVADYVQAHNTCACRSQGL